MKIMRKIALFFALFTAIIFLWKPIVLAQTTSTGVAIYLPVPVEVEDGMILCTTQAGNVPCTVIADPNIIGVFTLHPSVVLQTATPSADQKPVISAGKGYALVNESGGPIKKGDFITTSNVPGVGAKAARSGYVLGAALEDFVPTPGQTAGLVLVGISIKPAVITRGAADNLLSLLGQGLEVAFLTPVTALRYMLAAAVVVASVVAGLWYFGSISRRGIEALGRNPLAGTRIQISVIINVLLTIVIMVVGLGIAYLVLII